ncbi:MAG: ATP-dependent Clp protease proteolytic subunit [Alphaproteobacteria bacterium]|nr:ATP-dependent Clp protease proteolytic subunit [Alphaproteobacteria bacterium]
MDANTKVLLPDAKDTRDVDLDSLLLQERTVFLGTQVNAASAGKLIRQLLYLAHVDAKKPITLYLNSPGGSVVDGLAIYDTIRRISPPVHTVVAGMAASMGAIILSGCEKGERAILTHGEVLLHQPLGGAEGQATDIEITTRRLLKMKQILMQILADNTGQPIDKVTEDCDRDYWMGAEEALAYGICDKVLA